MDSPKAKVGYWLKAIKASKKAATRHWDESKLAYKEYEFRSVSDTSTLKSVDRRYAIYNTASQTVEPAYYSRTPKAISTRKHGIESPIALTMSLIQQRVAQYLLDYGFFDEGMIGGRQDFIHSAKATTQVVEIGSKKRVGLILSDGIYYDESTGSVYEGEALEDEEGAYYEALDDDTHEIHLKSCPFDEILHNPEAKSNSEIKWLAYKFCLTKEEALAKFDPTNERGLPFTKTSKSEDDDKESDDVEKLESVLEGWQIHCKDTKTVYWISEGFSADFLLKEADKLELRGFFPSPPFKIVNPSRKSLYPTPPYIYLEGCINQLHLLYSRQFKLISSIRRRALVSNASPELIDALNALGDQEYYAISNLQDILDKATSAGGVERLVWYVPVQELIAAINESMQLEEKFKQQFYEWFGVPDILRGISDPAETAEAQGIKSDAAHDRFKYNKKQMVDLAKESLEIMVDLAFKVFSDSKIAKIVGLEFLERGFPGAPPDEANPEGIPPEPGHYERFSEALARLRNDTERIVSVDLETDSTSFRDEAREFNKQQLIAQTLQNALAAISGMQDPNMVRITLRATMAVLEAMGGSTQVEDQLKKIGADLEKMASAPPPPPPPDYEGMKIQIEGQKVQLQGQKQQLDAMGKQRDLELKQQEMALEERDREFDRMLDSSKFQIEKVVQDFSATIEAQRLRLEQALVQLEDFKAQMQARESMMEERRLALETLISARNGSESEQREPQIVQVPMPQPPNINLTLDMPKPGKRTGTIIRPDGSVTKIEVEPPGL